jgi:CDP-diacylglycerol--glycerol-3-phosphate 3-phosphatidyltransferase
VSQPLVVTFARWAPLVVLAAFSLSFVAFAVRSALHGAPRSARVERAGGSVLLTRTAMEFGLWMFGPLTRTAIRLEIHPDALTWTSLVLQLGAAALLGGGSFGLGAALLVVGAFCDAADGAVARGRAMASDAGEVLDAAVDRWAEMAVFFGYAWYYRTFWPGFLVAAGACAGAVMVSYTRAKAEAFGVDAAGGLMQRHERAVWLSVATLGSSVWDAWHPPAPGAFALHAPVLVALAVIAVLANRTGWARMQAARRALRARERRAG